MTKLRLRRVGTYLRPVKVRVYCTMVKKSEADLDSNPSCPLLPIWLWRSYTTRESQFSHLYDGNNRFLLYRLLGQLTGIMLVRPLAQCPSQEVLRGWQPSLAGALPWVKDLVCLTSMLELFLQNFLELSLHLVAILISTQCPAEMLPFLW